MAGGVRIGVRVTGAGAPNDLAIGAAEVTVGVVVIHDVGTCAMLCSTVVPVFLRPMSCVYGCSKYSQSSVFLQRAGPTR